MGFDFFKAFNRTVGGNGGVGRDAAAFNKSLLEGARDSLKRLGSNHPAGTVVRSIPGVTVEFVESRAGIVAVVYADGRRIGSIINGHIVLGSR